MTRTFCDRCNAEIFGSHYACLVNLCIVNRELLTKQELPEKVLCSECDSELKQFLQFKSKA